MRARAKHYGVALGNEPAGLFVSAEDAPGRGTGGPTGTPEQRFVIYATFPAMGTTIDRDALRTSGVLAIADRHGLVVVDHPNGQPGRRHQLRPG